MKQARIAREASAGAIAALMLTLAIELATRGAPILVMHPLYLGSLALAAVLAAALLQRLRELRLLHGTALVTLTFALQLALMLVWGAGASWMLATRSGG